MGEKSTQITASHSEILAQESGQAGSVVWAKLVFFPGQSRARVGFDFRNPVQYIAGIRFLYPTDLRPVTKQADIVFSPS